MYAYAPPPPVDATVPRPVSLSATHVGRIVGLTDTNLHGQIHGGVILHLVDELGGAVAARHAGAQAVTATMDEFTFLTPVTVGDLVRAHGAVTWVGRTSMEVGVRVTAQRWDDPTAPVRHVASAYLVYVALDPAGSPKAVPPLVLETDVERRRHAEAMIRRESRLARRAAITAARRPAPDAG